MTARRRFVISTALAAFGVVVFSAAVFLGLGWIVTRRTAWLEKVMDPSRQSRLYRWYGHAANGLLPRDSDGDGYSDGIEIFFEVDAHKPASTPPAVLYLEMGPKFTIFCDEWMHVRGEWGVDDLIFGIVPGTQFTLSGSDPAMTFRNRVSDPGNPSMVAIANAEGALEFDVSLNAPGHGAMIIGNAKNGSTAYSPSGIIHGWRGKTVPVTFSDDDQGSPRSAPPNSDLGREDLNIYIARPQEWEQAAAFLLERRRQRAEEKWLGIAVLDPERGPAFLFRSEWLEEGSRLGEYEWRMTPALKAQPR